MKPGSKILRFGPNEIDLQNYELRRAGRRLGISKIPLDLLILLLERRGSLVTRAEITAHLWPNPELVDTERGINNAMNRIRALLNDDPAQPRYIETIIGRGYRFIGPVEEVANIPVTESVQLPEAPQPAEAQVPAFTERETTPAELAPAVERIHLASQASEKQYTPWLWTAIFLLLSVAVALWFWLHTHGQARMNWQATQITTSETDNPVTAGAISPDGKQIVYADPDGLFLRVLKAGATYRLRLSLALHINRISWFPDGLHLLLSCFDTKSSRFQIWSVPITGGDSVLIHEDASNATPSPDGSKLAFTAHKDSEIWIAQASGIKARLLVKGRDGEQLDFLFWANGGKRLSYGQRQYTSGTAAHSDHDLEADYRWSYGSRDAASGKELVRVADIRFESACETSNGQVFYLRTEPPQDGQLLGIWSVRTDPATGRFLSTPHQLASTGNALISNISASSDGKKITTVWERGQPDVYLADLQPTGPALANIHRLTSDSKNDFPHAWTRDSQSVIFESDREGDYHLFRQRLDERVPERLTDTEGQQVYPQLAPGGSIILYDQLPERYLSKGDLLYRVPLQGGRPVEVPADGQADEFRCPLIDTGSCVLREEIDHREFVFFALDPVRGKGAELGRTSWMPTHFTDWALSPDGKTAALPDMRGQPPVIRLVALEPSAEKKTDTEIAVLGIPVLWDLAWSADGLGWFAEARRNGISSLVYINRKGETHLLKETIYNTWGVPSPDGHKLAFVDYTIDRNMWLWQQP